MVTIVDINKLNRTDLGQDHEQSLVTRKQVKSQPGHILSVAFTKSLCPPGLLPALQKTATDCLPLSIFVWIIVSKIMNVSVQEAESPYHCYNPYCITGVINKISSIL
jgi:hypothetical protein